MALKTIQLNNVVLRAVMIVIALMCGYGTYFATKWTFGNTVAKQVDVLSQSASINPAEVKEVAQLAIDMAPNDPQAHYALATVNEKSFLPEDLPKALEGFEKAVSFSPNDFRLWLSLGKIREHSGNTSGAEKAFVKAVELAPNYSEPHWVLGNCFLRSGKIDEAFAEIRKAAETNPDYANQAVVTAWRIFDGDITQIAQKIGDSIPIKAGLAPFLAKQKRFDDAFSFWNSIPDREKATEYKKKGEELIGAFLEVKNYRYALTIQNQIAPETEKFVIGNIYNGGFEKEVKTPATSTFDWKLDDGNQPQISLDGSQKHEGERCLIVIFNSSTGQEKRSIQQTVAVEGGKTYKFEVFYRADLKATSTVNWEIVDAFDNKVLASTEAVQNNSTAWLPLTVDFTTAANTQAVIIRLTRVPCKQGICPISGKVWFDDLSLK